jgi:hypothetical protein
VRAFSTLGNARLSALQDYRIDNLPRLPSEHRRGPKSELARHLGCLAARREYGLSHVRRCHVRDGLLPKSRKEIGLERREECSAILRVLPSRRKLVGAFLVAASKVISDFRLASEVAFAASRAARFRRADYGLRSRPACC